MTPEAAQLPRTAAPPPPPAPDPGSRPGQAPDPGKPADEAQKRAIARAVWTDLLWLMPRDRTVTVTVRNGTVAVELEPAEPTPAAPADA